MTTKTHAHETNMLLKITRFLDKYDDGVLDFTWSLFWMNDFLEACGTILDRCVKVITKTCHLFKVFIKNNYPIIEPRNELKNLCDLVSLNFNEFPLPQNMKWYV